MREQKVTWLQKDPETGMKGRYWVQSRISQRAPEMKASDSLHLEERATVPLGPGEPKS